MERLLDLIFKRAIATGNLSVTSASGQTHSYGDRTGNKIAVRFTSAAWLRKVALNPELRLGEAYMEGGLVLDQGTIAEFLDLIVKNLGDKQPTVWSRYLALLRGFWRWLFLDNSLFRSSKNARHHYNIDHRIYRLFLDSDMQYSCAYFENPDMSIDEAQAAKKRHITNKLLIDRAGLRVLDIGSGWGGLGLHLARLPFKPSVTGINLSNEQVAIAQQRAKSEAVSCEFRIQDYRKVSEQFDRIVSVGMFEHVGKKHYDEFFRKCYDILADDGVMLLHTIGRWAGGPGSNPWVWKYIFPGGRIPRMSELTSSIERAGFIVSDIEVLRVHYAETLRHWRERFLARRDEALKIFDERFARMWEFYLAAFEPSFRYNDLEVFQIQLIKRNSMVPLTRDYIYSAPGGRIDDEMMRAAE
jgi:cyclopropane-fatty-acyl-phospholipid synthase